MCETALSPEQILRRGEGAVVFAHASACRTCQNALLQQGAYAPGCSEPVRGHDVLLNLETLAEGVGEPEVVAHVGSCPACALEVREAQEALGISAAPVHGHGHPRFTFRRWLIGGLLLVLGATAHDRPPQRLVARRAAPLPAPAVPA